MIDNRKFGKYTAAEWADMFGCIDGQVEVHDVYDALMKALRELELAERKER